MPYKDIKKQREYQLKWCLKRRENWIEKNGPCKKCGSNEDLEVDHINKENKFDYRVWSWSLERRQEELKKCQVLCGKCHLEKTLSERKKTEHGKGWMYVGHKCRCDLCREWKRLDDRKRRGKSTPD